MFRRITIRPTDKRFSLYIRKRDNHTCQRCLRYYENGIGLDCSHFWGRGRESTRFDPFNCVALCRACHQYFTSYPAEHDAWYRKRLGDQQFKLLMVRAHTVGRRDEKMTMLYIEKLEQELRDRDRASADLPA